MDRYITGAVVKRLRESRKLTQEELAERIHVSGKAVSKWETGAGFPDISLLEPLAEALGISVIELLSGEDVRNENRSFNMEKRGSACALYAEMSSVLPEMPSSAAAASRFRLSGLRTQMKNMSSLP